VLKKTQFYHFLPPPIHVFLANASALPALVSIMTDSRL
jgi:hypothetical protein